MEAELKKRITIIGAGSVGTALALACSKEGYEIAAVYSRNASDAVKLARRVSAGEASALVDRRKPISGMVFLTVPDDAVAAAAATMAAQQKHWKGVTVYHTSGALASPALSALKKSGASTGSFHPLQTFPKQGKPGTLGNVHVCVEGDAAAVSAGKNLASELGAHPFVLTEKQKVLYHIAAVFSPNYVVTLLSIVEKLGSQFGLEERATISLFRPLLETTIENVYRMGATHALTGPIARWDVETIRRHTNALSNKKFNGILSLYASLGLATVRLASMQQGVDRRRKK